MASLKQQYQIQQYQQPHWFFNYNEDWRQIEVALKRSLRIVYVSINDGQYKQSVLIFLFSDMYSYTIILFQIKQMGNKVSGKVQKLKNKFTSSSISSSNQLEIGANITCPNCNKYFPANTLQSIVQNHLTTCLKADKEKEIESSFIVPSKNQKVILNYDILDYFYMKEPTDQTYTVFKWHKSPIKNIEPSIFLKSPQQIKTLCFQQKIAWFRFHLQRFRISWMNGADFMRIEKDNILVSSLVESKKVNMFKQVKIQFKNEKVNDAGGLLRQWMYLVANEMFSETTGIFKLCNSDDSMYKLKWDEEIDEEFSSELLKLFGTILGKAIFQKIPMNTYLDRTMLRQLLSKNNSIEFQDVFGYDKELYQNWKFLLDNQIDQMGLQTYFTVTKENSDNSTIQLIQLVEGGKDLLVTDQNKKMYISLCIQTICKQKVMRSIDFIRAGLYKVVPQQLLSVFQPYQLQMILYGVPYIDVKDWKINTDYRGQYKANHQIIQWFWEVVSIFDQEQLARLLKFSTGSSRTPIHGFKKLESNRGNFSKFLIQSSEFNKINPYPKGHTCFNRLELPKYPTKEHLKIYVTAIVNNNLDGVFGLD